MIIIATISIFLIASIIMFLRNRQILKICPICAGVTGTWIWILVGIWTGLLEADSWRLVAAIAMGGSVVGIAYQLEKKVRAEKSIAWKILFIPTGFALTYNLIYFSWIYAALLLIVISFLLFIFLGRPVFNGRHANKDGRVVDIEEEMKNCC
ncbi:MAG: hypothetical protein A3J46_03890 [Candidatus Yanofskybacteria bacterium RIFCSPHIGHO2_02_FULL_41_11]|uniref:Uncharacterized protein n=2 Tax=Candidatus Yanofskyibacteriota TaxID=1752733 RepID=A0A1F8F5Z1_9BACT|nr:MAG: hypothetical protein A2817_01090 [Candidatus Yanofskybacteria bacterium RIFCSPHIGHO2_01_FULL_39_8b]OGN08564.1 MAG: hypothetical protein A3J46_03890 [Candidatus Yanofskybacteria bacterium RIFCSPHIGHO2_02_FULL_41_11]